jgi:hypothetical protein
MGPDQLVFEDWDEVEHRNGIIEPVVTRLESPHHHAVARTLLPPVVLQLGVLRTSKRHESTSGLFESEDSKAKIDDLRQYLGEEILVLASRLHNMPEADARQSRVIRGKDEILKPRVEHVLADLHVSSGSLVPRHLVEYQVD